MQTIRYSEGISDITFENILGLYTSVCWTKYTNNPDSLKKALKNSSHIVCALHDGILVGLARSLSDDVSIHFIQDILVLNDYHRQGIGKHMIKLLLDHYKHVRQHALLTDDQPDQHAFYKACGFQKLPAQPVDSSGLTNGYIKL